ncbi:MAG: hypothetical protein U0Q18_16265 [Bryobacteraceae bacterium]
MADIYLKHFEPGEIIITPDDANLILRFFFGNQVPPADQLTGEDVQFAQALFLEAIDKSYAMGYIHIVYDCFYMKIPGSFDDVKEIAKEFAKKAVKHWFDHATGKDLSKPEIYAAVRGMMEANFRSIWALRMQGAGLTY